MHPLDGEAGKAAAVVGLAGVTTWPRRTWEHGLREASRGTQVDQGQASTKEDPAWPPSSTARPA